MSEPFSAEYFQHLLGLLTQNSRTFIAQLTAMAEEHVDHAPAIVRLVEERIQKILPQYKLITFYLMDSIVKNVGNPYNLLFANNLYKCFAESYLVVTDTATRQNLINLFKTWMEGKTSAGGTVFPQEVLAKIEQFIIKATSLNTVPDETVRITRDRILREGNYLLQYIIAMDADIDKFLRHFPEEGPLENLQRSRNELVLTVNAISEKAMIEPKDVFDANKEMYAESLKEIRRQLDEQSFQQQASFKSISESQGGALSAAKNSFSIDPKPKFVDMTVVLKKNEEFEAYITGWGVDVVETTMIEKAEAEETPQVERTEPALAPLGISFNFLDSFLGLPKNELTASAESVDSIETYSPLRKAPPTVPMKVKSSLKRTAEGQDRVVKKVRFDV